MTRLTAWQAAIAIAGLAIFLWGIRVDNDLIRWVGVGALVVAFAFRFIKRSG